MAAARLAGVGGVAGKLILIDRRADEYRRPVGLFVWGEASGCAMTRPLKIMLVAEASGDALGPDWPARGAAGCDLRRRRRAEWGVPEPVTPELSVLGWIEGLKATGSSSGGSPTRSRWAWPRPDAVVLIGWGFTIRVVGPADRLPDVPLISMSGCRFTSRPGRANAGGGG
jgi:hypothetical protein